MAMLAWTGSYAYSPTLSFQGGAYFRAFNQAHVDGNPTDLEPCDPSIGPFSCLNGSPVHDTLGNIIPDSVKRGNDRSRRRSTEAGRSRALSAPASRPSTPTKLAGHDNTLTVGASLDYGWTRFNGNSQFGTIFNDNNTSFPVIGAPFIIDEPDSFLNPFSVHANNTYTGLYALDTYSVNDRLTVTAGGRFNYAGINLEGTQSALLTGFSNFFHVNPTVGFTYKLTPDINFYAGYAMTNRTPTPLELGCADPNNPCIIDNFLVSDPKLKQVVGQTFEVGFRGHERCSANWVWLLSGASCNGRPDFSAPRSTTTSCRSRARLPASAFSPMSERPCARGRRPASNGPAIAGRLTPITPISTRFI